jgi:hypothetical protein
MKTSITLLAYQPPGTPPDAWPPISLAPQKNDISLYAVCQR